VGQLEDMAMFVRIVEAGGVGRAAEQLDLAKSAVSRRLVELEKRLGARLLNRTTRKSSLTDAGNAYYQHALKVLDDVSAFNSQISDQDANLSGTLRMTVPLSFGLLHLRAAMDDFARQHPNLCLQIDFVDQHIDLVEAGYELAIRIADLKDSSLQAKRITPIRHVLCASPDYLRHHGHPKQWADLGEHCFLQYSLHSQSSLHLTDPDGHLISFPIKPKVKANNGDFLKDLAVSGHGITLLPTFITHQAMASGALVPVLAQYQWPTLYAYAVYPQTRFLSRRCRLLIDLGLIGISESCVMLFQRL
jgi:DNA-binding transcriptional LysR family regulator